MSRPLPRFLLVTRHLSLVTGLVLSTSAFAEPLKKEARVTQVIREVNLLPADAPARLAVVNENVRETTAVKTGGGSRAELTFIDLTITRLGADTLYSFKNSGRRVDLRSGSTLLRVPKDSGGATIATSAVTAGSTGTTLIFENISAGGARLTVLEGSARLTLVKHPDQSRGVNAGQSLEVPGGATRIPDPKEIDLDRLMKTSPLIIGFRPLPSQNLINNAIRQQQQRGGLNQPNRNAPPGPQNQPAPQPPPGPGR
jgi:ferric-dicitrate binding protein FerR (iron transport regulator)